MNGTMDLLIAKTGISYAAAKGVPATPEAAVDPADLEVGAIGIYAEIDGNTVLLIEDDVAPTTVTAGALSAVAATAALKNGIDRVFIAEGVPAVNGSVRMTGPIFLKNPALLSYKSLEYTAGSAQVTTVGDATDPLVVPGTPAGLEISIHIWETKASDNRDSVHLGWDKFNPILGGAQIISPTIAEIVTELAARINASSLPVTATTNVSAGDEHVIITADVIGDTFAVNVAGWSGASAVVVTTTAAVLPMGDLTHLQKIERRVQQMQGDFAERDGLIPAPASRLAGTAYDLYQMEYYPSEHGGIFGGEKSVQGNQANLLNVAFEDGDNDAAGQNQADFTKIMTNLLGLAGADETVKEEAADATA